MARSLHVQAAEVAERDRAGRIISDPERAACSVVGRLALAQAAENFWQIAVDAYELAGLHQRRMHILSGQAGDQGNLEIDEIERRMDALAAQIRAQVAGHGGGDIQTETNKGDA